jgi:NAD(P)-dependent dehydrogenase (short-subunit alcohol dehydrogenase family)
LKRSAGFGDDEPSALEHAVTSDAPIDPGRKNGYRLASALMVGGVAAAVFARRAIQERRARRRVQSLHGRTVLISGGATGLGFLLAQEFGRWGARVWIVSRTPAEVEEAECELRARGVDAHGMVGDIRDPFSVRELVSKAMTESGRLDILVNNAGIIQATPLEHARLEDFADSLRTHLWGPLHLTREALPHMRRQGSGHVVNIASIGGRVAVPHLVPYCVGKFALVGFSEGLRAEVWKDGIAVTTVCPGLMRTGSHVRARVRGQHAREARWFGLAVATPLSSMSARRAAERIVWATVQKRARVTLGWQARAAEVVDTLAPELSARMASAVTELVLPRPVEAATAGESRIAGDVGFGWLTPLLARPAEHYHPHDHSHSHQDEPHNRDNEPLASGDQGGVS